MLQKLKNIYHLFQAGAANIFYGFPSRKLTVIGVTGTDGKTTTTSIIYQILKSSGKKVAMITSVGAYIGDKVYDIGFHVTTPSPFGLQKYIKKAADAGMEYLVLETTSHALDQNRVWGIPYKIGVLTNITHEHLDYHKTYEEYARTKFKLINNCETGIVNMDDESFILLKRVLPLADKKILITYSLDNQSADYTPKKFQFTTKLLGDFNKYNCLAAIAACKSLGLKDDQIRKALLSFKAPPGRQEMVYDKEFKVMIDFAHTPNAFAKILPEVKKITKGKLIHVFGAAGKRDFTKRPEMGAEAAKFDDVIILTAEDPRDETIQEINREIIRGVGEKFYPVKSQGDIKDQILNIKNIFQKANLKKVLIEVPDRKEAIELAISIAKKGDTLILTGKSHEKSMNLGNGEEPWDEFEVTKEMLNSRGVGIKHSGSGGA
jgi:UDP-N-acetylmuramoyl-L-alanyl-D-glutamate--2,6-diaminopimelate ligase